MRKLILLAAIGVLLNLLTGCQKDSELKPENNHVTLTFQIDIMDAGDQKKTGLLEDWKHPIDIIVIELTNEETGEVVTEEFASIEALVMVVPAGNYLASVSTVSHEVVSPYVQFSTEKRLNAMNSANISMETQKTQSLLTVSNSELIPQVNGVDLFEKQGIYYAYVIDWNGKWKYGEKNISTSEAPEPGMCYHFKVNSDGLVEEGIEEWDENYESILDQLVQKYLYDATNPEGFLTTVDPSAGAIWKMNATDENASHEISATVAHLLYLAGYREVSILGYEANWHNINDNENLNGASLYGLMGGYEATGDIKYKALAEEIMPQVVSKFSPDGTNPARPEKWGYDYINFLEGARKAAKHGLEGAQEYYEILKTDYLANYERIAKDDYQRLYVNAIYDRLNIGSYQGFVDWDHIYTLQDASAGLMGNSWENPSNVKKYMIDDLSNNIERAEDLAEAVYALGL